MYCQHQYKNNAKMKQCVSNKTHNYDSSRYHGNPKYWGRQAWAKSKDLDQTAPIGAV